MRNTTQTNTASSIGGQALVRRRGTSYMRYIGRIGGNTVVRKYGTDYMSALGELANPSLSQRRRRELTKVINRALEIANA